MSTLGEEGVGGSHQISKCEGHEGDGPWRRRRGAMGCQMSLGQHM